MEEQNSVDIPYGESFNSANKAEKILESFNEFAKNELNEIRSAKNVQRLDYTGIGGINIPIPKLDYSKMLKKRCFLSNYMA